MERGEIDGWSQGGTVGSTDEQLSRLFAEIRADSSTDPVDLDRSAEGEQTPDQRAEELLDSILETLFPDSRFRFDEELVKQSLDEILILLIATRSGDTNGKALMTDLARLFDSQLSPGTVYPALHEMENDDVLEMFELVRSKEYGIRDREDAASMVTEAARQYLALGAFFYSAAGEL